MGTYDYCINIPLYRTYLQIITDVNNIAKAFDMIKSNDPVLGESIVITIRFLGYWSVNINDYEYKLFHECDVFVIVQETIENAYKSFINELIILHGSAVAKKEKTFVFIAPTKTGKSTLSAYMKSKGYTSLSDDMVVIEKVTGRIIPVPHFHILRDIKYLDNASSFDMCISGRSDLRNENINVLASKVPLVIENLQIQNSLIMVLRRTNSYDNEMLTKCSYTDAFYSVLSNAKWESSDPRLLRDIISLVKKVDVFYLNNSSLIEVNQVIDKLL